MSESTHVAPTESFLSNRRYRLSHNANNYSTMVQYEYGSWVRIEDAEAQTHALEQRVEQLEGWLNATASLLGNCDLDGVPHAVAGLLARQSPDTPDAAVVQVKPITPENSIDVATVAASRMRAMGLNELAEDIEARIRLGEKKYGSRLKAFNSRDARIDLRQELDDACNYSMQCVIEGLDDDSLFIIIAGVAELVRRRQLARSGQ